MTSPDLGQFDIGQRGELKHPRVGGRRQLADDVQPGIES
jgi:hypothetical protein